MISRASRISVVAILMLAIPGLPFFSMAQNKPVPLINQPLVPDAVRPAAPPSRSP